MKTKTSKLLIASLAITAVFFLSSFFTHQQNKNKYLTMRVFEPYGLDARITLVYEDGKTEEIDLGEFKSKNYLPNTIKINETINTIANKGYDLFSVSGSGVFNTYTFIKI